MIQRRQTLFLLQLVFCGIALLFISSVSIISNTGTIEVYLTPSKDGAFVSTLGHLAAITINFIGLIVTFVTIFLYRNRAIQIKLCYALILIWLSLSLMILFCPFVEKTEQIQMIQINYFATVIGLVAITATYFAIKFIKKDIALIKSADRIR
jgi:hypothetical protein